MAIRKVLGTETEYGIIIRNQRDFNPALASALVINSYDGRRVRVQWSYEEETPGRDARGFGHEGFGVSDPDSALVNAVLSNGARLYVDHAHPEYSGPECWDPLEGALHDKAGEAVMARAMRNAQSTLPQGQVLKLYKNNSDGKGNSYGAHENYLLERITPFGAVIRHLTPFFVTRQIFTGAGKVGSENGRPGTPYQITQRADFFEETVGLETTLKRPIINTRDEPHGDPGKYRRLHVIIGDANLSEVQTFLKLGVTALFLAALEDDALPEALDLANPVEACWQVSHDLDMSLAIEMDDGSTATALQMQFRYLEWLKKYAESELDEPVWDVVLEEWESVLGDLERDPALTADRLDWVAKRRLIDGYTERDGLEPDDPKLRGLDLQYHDVDPASGLYHRLAGSGRMRRLFTDEQVHAAMSTPPERTRAWFRGTCVERFSESMVAANWDSLVFDTDEAHLKRVPMMEPLRGSKATVGPLLDSVETAAELLQALEG
ncbi:MAG: depupylase/deamidase Dop [Acidimicrobiia bacterium]